jgi:hypothetical protein
MFREAVVGYIFSSRIRDPLESTVISSVERRRARPASLSNFHRIKLIFLVAAFASLVLSVSLWFSGARDEGVFVGLWVPAIHSLGTLILTGERDRVNAEDGS